MTEISDDTFRIDVSTAEQLIRAAMTVGPVERVPLAAATGRVLRTPVVAERDQPPFDRATMDGIAITASSLASERHFRVAGTQAAGHAVQTLPDADACLEVMTGAVVPTGADTVVPVERTRETGTIGIVALETGYVPERGQFIHRRASDHAQGDRLLEPGIRLRGPEMAILTAAGKPDVTVARTPAVAVISTGDELVDVGMPLTDYQIRSSNDRAIEAALALRKCDRVERAHLPDSPAELLSAIRDLHERNDVLVLSGGVSMGKYDYVPGILTQLGVQLVFHKILQRPGLPMWFGVSAAGKPVFALPGNPVSTLVCLVRYVIPALEYSMGLAAQLPVAVRLGADVSFEPDLCWFLPVAIMPGDDGLPVAMPQPTNTSGDFVGLRGTDGFVELPRGQSLFEQGYGARFFPW